MNKTEMKTLNILEKNCRFPANQIAKKTRLSTEGVIKIIKRLESKGIISKFNTKINYSRMGYRLFPVKIKLLRLNNKIIKDIKKLISKHETCAWHMFCEGEYDLLLSFKIMNEKDKLDMDKFLWEISDNILEKELSIALHAFEINKSFLPQEKEKTFPIFDHNLEKAELSNEEIKLIKSLRNNSRETVLNISNKINLSPRVVASKIKKLEKSGVISGFKTKINLATLNYQSCIALINFSKYTNQELMKFTAYCQHRKGINYFVRQIGKYDVALTIDIENTNEFYKLIEEIREQFSFIKKITTLISKGTS
tara:strand:- start:4417 stop:5343 length:927 start_codon:yes stop_codon:yes gene_type:complete